ncbi:MAG: hypothetical protein R6X11_08290 [Desulfonatronovibrio sp.]
MSNLDRLRKELEELPPELLDEAEKIIMDLKARKTISGESAGLLRKLASMSVNDDLPLDLAEQHDHYLYGSPKK